MMQRVIETRNLSKRFGAVTALDDVSLVVERGEFVAFMGASGSGKTTLMNILTCLDTATEGQVILDGTDAAALDQIAQRLSKDKDDFVRRHEAQGKFSIDVQRAEGQVTVKVSGASAHGSRPEEGVNPVPRLALFLQQSLMPDQGAALVQPNQYSQAVRYINGVFGLDYFGKQLGIAYADDFMGPLTLSPNLIKSADGKLEVTANARMPRGKTPEQLRAEVEQGIARWSDAAKVPVSVQYTQGNWMARDPKGAWLGTLLNIFGDTTGLDAKPVATAGSTTAKLMPNAINFGPAMPGKKYTAHNALEYQELPDLRTDMQMFTEMLVRIGNLQQMQ